MTTEVDAQDFNTFMTASGFDSGFHSPGPRSASGPSVLSIRRIQQGTVAQFVLE